MPATKNKPPTAPKLEPLAKIADVAEFLNVPVSSVYELCYRQQIPFLRVGKSYRFDLEAVRQHVMKSA